ncbi:MAG: hypothetical protein ACK2UK_15085 [Candidatus Promineifilaceae bacterium]
MERVFVFLIHNDIWITILAALGLFWYVSDFLRARRSLRSAVFGLEREKGLRRRNNALFFIGLFSLIIGTVIFVNRQIAPTLPPELLRPPTPTPNPQRTPLSPPTAIGEPAGTRLFITPDLAPTVTLIGPAAPGDAETAPAVEAVTATPTPYIPPTPFIACTADLNFSDPRNGAAVNGDIAFYGTADTEIFGAYSLETNGPQTNGQWASLLGRQVNQPVREGFLGNANLSMWDPGPYLMRLTVTDSEDNVIGQCVIQVTLSGSS